MDIDTFSLQCFIAVAETSSFTKAGEFVKRTQSAISQQVAKLEKLLNKQLIIRKKMITLTPEGELFLSYARKIVALHFEAIDRFKKPDLEGEVRFGLPEDFASVFLSEVLANFLRIHPRIILNIECDFTLNLLERFKKQEFDLVLVKVNRPEDFPNGLDVWSEPLQWVGDQRLIDNQKPIPLVLSPSPCVYRTSAINALVKARRKWRIVFTSPSYAGTVGAVRAGMGLTIMPHTMIPDDLESIDFSMLPNLSDTHVSMLKYKTDQPAINTLEEFVIRKLKH